MATSLVLTTFLLHTAVLIVTQVAGTFDLSVVSMTRTLSEDRTQMTLTAGFTASEEPQVAFRTYYNALPGSTVEYADGRGTASLTTPVRKWTVIAMRIGKFDIHYLDVWMDLKKEEMDQVSMTQMLNTRPSTLSPGNDIAYSRGESFDVIVGVDWSPAETFFWPSPPRDRDSNYMNAKLTSYYLDQASGEVVRTWDFPSVGNFLTVNKTYQDGYLHHNATLQMSFSTAEEPVYGFFEIFAYSRFSHYSNDDHFVTDLAEYIIITVHESTTPGPFPAGFNYVKATSIPETCSADETSCLVNCDGSSNDLKSLVVYKVEEDGTHTDLSEESLVESGKYFAEVVTDYQNRADSATGQFVCKVTSRDGSSATGTVTLFRD